MAIKGFPVRYAEYRKDLDGEGQVLMDVYVLTRMAEDIASDIAAMNVAAEVWMGGRLTNEEKEKVKRTRTDIPKEFHEFSIAVSKLEDRFNKLQIMTNDIKFRLLAEKENNGYIEVIVEREP